MNPKKDEGFTGKGIRQQLQEEPLLKTIEGVENTGFPAQEVNNWWGTIQKACVCVHIFIYAYTYTYTHAYTLIYGDRVAVRVRFFIVFETASVIPNVTII